LPIKYALELVLLSAIWGASFLFMRTTTGEFGSILLITLRTGIAALVLLPFLLYQNKLQLFITHWRVIFVVGLTNTAIPFCLFSYSTFHLGAGYSSVLNATAPMFSGIVAFLWLKESLHRLAIIGLFVGFCGVIVLSFARQHLEMGSSLLPIVAALVATFLYGIAACTAKRYLTGVNALAIATGSQCFAFLSLLPLSIFFLPPVMPSSESWWQVLILGLVCTAFAYILYFRLMSNVGVTKTITVAYLVPVFGVLWGIVFLNESVTMSMLTGASLILMGVALTTGLLKRKKVPLIKVV
jgi:drug/metabolite transporter (DMT)-like permease